MRCVSIFLVAILMLMNIPQASQAGWREGWNKFWTRVDLDFHRMNQYPEPFIQASREVTQLPFQIMVNKGWKLQNTLGDYHFNPETQQLTHAGELKLRAILTNNSVHRRDVFVLRGSHPQATSARIDSVQLAVARSLPGSSLPLVLETSNIPHGWPASYVEAIDRKMKSSLPIPRLPAVKKAFGS